jgi:uncharacterized protein (DUF2236 family)
MACPAGYTNRTVTQEKEISYEKPKIFPTIAEPKEILSHAEESIFLLVGHYAILFQLAYPGLAQGTFEHSSFPSRLLNHLQTTARFLNVCITDPADEKEAIFSFVHRAQSSVEGVTYSADDPELDRWTVATLFVSLVVVHEGLFGNPSREKMETLFKKGAIYGSSLRMPPDMWPSTLDDFWAYWIQKIETLDGLGTEFVQGPAASKTHSNLAEAAEPGSKAADEPVAARKAV